MSIEQVYEEIEKAISNSKSINFNSDRGKSNLLGKIWAILENNITENANNQESLENGRVRNLGITQPKQNKEQRGYAVMTEGNSQKGDDILENKTSKNRSE